MVAGEAEALVRISRGLDRPGLLGFVTFILPIILDGLFQRLAPRLFEINTIALLQRDGISFAEVDRVRVRVRVGVRVRDRIEVGAIKRRVRNPNPNSRATLTLTLTLTEMGAIKRRDPHPHPSPNPNPHPHPHPHPHPNPYRLGSEMRRASSATRRCRSRACLRGRWGGAKAAQGGGTARRRERSPSPREPSLR